MSWLWIIQAILIGVLFMGSNYYLWLGMERIPGSERYRKYVPPMLIGSSPSASWSGRRRARWSSRSTRRGRWAAPTIRVLGFLGVMSAKNTAVNLMILTTFLSYVLYRRANRISTKPWVEDRHGDPVGGLRRSPRSIVDLLRRLRLLRRVDRPHRLLRVPGARGARRHRASSWRSTSRCSRARAPPATIRWGTIAPRSQYVLILLAVTFTWLMGLMGFARSGIRQHWHVYGVHARHLGRGGDARARLRGQRDHAGHDRLLRAGHVHLLARRPRREGQGRGARPRRARSSPAAASRSFGGERTAGSTLDDARAGRRQGRGVLAGRDGRLHVLRELDPADRVQAAARSSRSRAATSRRPSS